MGQGESTPSDADRLFEALDKDKSGDLSMNELLSIQEMEGLNLPFTNSPLLLFKYNEAEDGRITKEDFLKLVHFFQGESKKLQKRFEHVSSAVAASGSQEEKDKEKDKPLLGLFPRRNTLKRSQSRSDITLGVRTCINAKDDLHLSRDSSTPMLTGRVRPEEVREEQAREKEALEEMLHEPPVDTRKLVKKILADEEGQQKFLAWLFRFADVDHKEVISVAQLSKLLKVLAKDGINVATLSYDQSQTNANVEHVEDDPAYAQRLLEEYDIGHTGYLTKDEFLKLGDLILRQYAQESSADHDVVKNYILGRKLGVGATGVVRLAVHRDSHARKAVKIIHRGDVTDMSRLDTEIKAMLLLRHPRVVLLDEVLEDSEKIYFVMELCGGGSLADLVAEKPLDERLARFYFAELVEGVSYCHAQGVCHRDLKLENLLCDNLGHLKITDFGHAGIFQKGWDIFQTGLVGTLWHLAPEQIAGQAYSGERVDVWAMGVALYRMVSGEPPFLSSNPVEFLEMVKAIKWERKKNFSPELISLLESVFVASPDQRATLEQLAEHPWLKGEKRAPEFLRKQLWIGKWADIEVPWRLMLEIVNELHIFCCTVAPEGENVTALRKMIKCQVPEKDLKFSISFKNKRTENPFFSFKLREGEAEVFHELCARISTKFEEKMADQRLHEAKEQRSSTLTGGELHLENLIIDDYTPGKALEATSPRSALPRPTSPSVLSSSNTVLDHRDGHREK